MWLNGCSQVYFHIQKGSSLFLSFLSFRIFSFFKNFLACSCAVCYSDDFRISLLSYVKILLTLWLGLHRIYTLTHEEFKYLQHCFQVGTGHFRI